MSPKPYLYIEELSDLTPWSADAIRSKIKRGELEEGIHFFRPEGPGSRVIFSWTAVQRYIERKTSDRCGNDAIPMADGSVAHG